MKSDITRATHTVIM